MPADTLLIGPLPGADSVVFSANLDSALAAPPVACSAADTVVSVTEQEPAPWLSGLEGEERAVPTGADSGILSLVTGLLLMMMFIVHRCRKLFGSLWQELLGMRSRANAFDDRTSGESSALTLMAVQWSVCAGILLYSALALGVPYGTPILAEPRAPFVAMAMLVGLAMAYYVAQLAVYWLLGWVFADPAGRRLYVQGFTASQSLLGFALLVPALVSIFYQGAAPAMVALAAGLYVLARIIFIIKGFRIFYRNFGSLLYFILYLCAVEILPLIFVCGLAEKIWQTHIMV